MAEDVEGGERLRAELLKWKELKSRYPVELKERAVSYARKRRRAGKTQSAVAVELGLSPMTLHGWLKGGRGRRGKKRPLLLPVEIAAEKPGRERKSGGAVVVARNGVRVEGLSVEEIAGLLGRLS
ncbi:MAG: hypothetical protein AB1405_06555 [Bdellovibrionota bacterium]